MRERLPLPKTPVRAVLIAATAIPLVTGLVFLVAGLSQAAALESLTWLGVVAGGSAMAGALVALVAARLIARPIDELVTAVSQAAERPFDVEVKRSGQSREADALADSFNTLVSSLRTAEANTRGAYIGVIESLAAALDARDRYTAGHSERVGRIAVVIGQSLGLPREELDVLHLGALLHDIGKIGIRDDVLGKKGPLTDDEMRVVRTHTHHGERILQPVPFLAPYLPIVAFHHERPDGLGYPYGLRGDEIPIAARIVRVADAFDAMTSARAYRPAMSAEAALSELRHFAGSQFDAQVVDALIGAYPAAAAHINGRAAAPAAPEVPFADARELVHRMSSSDAWRELATSSRESARGASRWTTH